MAQMKGFSKLLIDLILSLNRLQDNLCSIHFVGVNNSAGNLLYRNAPTNATRQKGTILFKAQLHMRGKNSKKYKAPE